MNFMNNVIFEYLKINCRVVVSNKNEYSTKDDTIYLKPFSNLIDSAYFFAHECYHAYQWKYKRYLFKKYKERSECATLDEYNNQRIEYEANAFACWFIDRAFDGQIKVNLSHLSATTRKKIEERKKRGF